MKVQLSRLHKRRAILAACRRTLSGEDEIDAGAPAVSNPFAEQVGNAPRAATHVKAGPPLRNPRDRSCLPGARRLMSRLRRGPEPQVERRANFPGSESRRVMAFLSLPNPVADLAQPDRRSALIFESLVPMLSRKSAMVPSTSRPRPTIRWPPLSRTTSFAPGICSAMCSAAGSVL